jgi:thioredoxin 1
MDGIQKTFGDQVEIIFYDVWEDPAAANEYGVQMIPTQVFLDEKGEELHRHVGFYPQAEIEALLVEQGLTKLTTP